jgi:hypothetical protein
LNAPAARAAYPSATASTGAAAVAGRGGGAATLRASTSWSSRVTVAARACWASASAVVTRGQVGRSNDRVSRHDDDGVKVGG